MKYIAPILIFSLLILYSPFHVEKAHAALADGLQSCWSFDEVSGDRADSQGSNTLTDVATVSSNTGKFSNATDMVRANSEYLRRNDSGSSPDLSITTGEFTIGGWIYFDDVANTQVLFAKYNTTGNQREYQSFIYSSGGIEDIRWGNYNSAQTNQFIETESFADFTTGTWYFLVMRASDANNELSITVNDGTADTNSSFTNVPFDGTGGFSFGSQNYETTADFFMDGRHDEWFVYNRVITDAEEAQLYNSGTGMSCDEIIAATGGGESTTQPSTTLDGNTTLHGNNSVY